MEPNVNYTLVGAFVIVLLASLIFTIIWLSAGITGKHYVLYRVYMNESVTGLSQDATVKYNGVEVGTVKEIKLSKLDPQQVKLLLQIEEGTPITKSTVAILTTQGLTGVAYIDLKTRGTDNTPLIAMPGEPYPVIKTAPSLLLRVDTAVSQLITNFNTLTTSLSGLLNTQNRQAIQETLQNLAAISNNLANNNKEMAVILKNTAAATQKLPAMLQNSQAALQTLTSQTLPQTNQ